VKPVELLGCGALNLDLIYRLPATFPLWDELGPAGREASLEPGLRRVLDEALAYVTPERAGGGQAANTVHALAKMGYRAAMCGRVGDDDDGAFLLGELRPAETRLVARGGESGRVYVLLDEEGERRNFVWPGANDAFAPADVPRRPPKTRFALFTSFLGDGPLEGQLALLERLPASVEVAFDPGEVYARKGVKRFLPVLHRCAYLLATEPELETLCGLPLDEALDFLLNAGVGLVVCKMGARGARLIGRRVDLLVPPRPTTVVDVTGAGDVFAAGFIAGLLEELGLEAAGRLGAWAAARAIGGPGRSTYPDADDWAARLREERDGESGRRW